MFGPISSIVGGARKYAALAEIGARGWNTNERVVLNESGKRRIHGRGWECNV
jgi:hypothetical protein